MVEYACCDGEETFGMMSSEESRTAHVKIFSCADYNFLYVHSRYKTFYFFPNQSRVSSPKTRDR